MISKGYGFVISRATIFSSSVPSWSWGRGAEMVMAELLPVNGICLCDLMLFFVLLLWRKEFAPKRASSFLEELGVPVAQWVKRWPTDLALEAKSSHRKRGSIAHSISLSSAHCPDMTEILVDRT